MKRQNIEEEESHQDVDGKIQPRIWVELGLGFGCNILGQSNQNDTRAKFEVSDMSYNVIKVPV